MSTTEKSELLRTNAKRAIDAIVQDHELDDDTKEELLEDLEEHVQDSQRILSDYDDDEADDDEDDEDEDDEHND